uniref:Uncharacterized protein n=1 Tax=Alexandrium catenella TaxID=2925 RepID=A0A7S1PR59_ALECA|mmetsp:Transcript_106709/g.283861  ORF Transcript_106709/g.283861 Transcript_106709/m.283861 type:complete len:338 (+) Transcript_106709:129-1142(+)
MGNVPQVKCHENVDSPTDSGFKSVVSESLEDYCTADAFYDSLWLLMRSPVHPMEAMMVKEQQVVDQGEEEFTIKVIYDGQKLKLYGLAPESRDYYKLNQKVVGNRKELTIVCQDMKGDGTHLHTGCCKLLRDPARLEYSRIVDGERRSGQALASLVETTYIAPVLTVLARRKAKVLPNHVSELHGGGPSVISEPLDEWLTYDMAFEFFVEAVKYPPGVEDHGEHTRLVETDDSFELVCFEHEQLRALNYAKDSTLPARDMTYMGRVDKAAGEIVVICSVGRELLFTSFTHFHRDPVRIESWQVADGKRLGGLAEACVLQGYVDMIVRKAEGSTGWYF